MTIRERLAIRLLGLVSFVLPADHHALIGFHNLAAEIEHPPENVSTNTTTGDSPCPKQ